MTSFQVDQPTGAGSGIAGEARIDLWLNQAVNLTCLSPPEGATIQWTLDYVPAGSSAVLANPGSTVASFTPDVATRSYRVHLQINAGGVGNEFTFVLCCTRDSFGSITNNGWRTPALNEQGTDQNQGGNVLGYLPDYDQIILDLAAGGGGGGGGGPTYTAATVTHTNSPYNVLITDKTIKFDQSGWDGSAAALQANLTATPTIGEEHNFKWSKWAVVGTALSPPPIINAGSNFVQLYGQDVETSGAQAHTTAITDPNGTARVIWDGTVWLMF